MGFSQQSVVSSLNNNNHLWSKFVEAQGKRKSIRRKPIKKGILMKRRARLDRHTRPTNEVERKVKVLKRLIPNAESTSTGVEGLFRDTADYILALRMRVKLMQIMVNVLSGSDDQE